MSKVKHIPLGEVGTFQRGGNFKKSDFIEDGYPCIHYGQIHTKFGASTSSHLTCIPEVIASKCPKATKGDLVIAITSEDVAGSCKCTTWLGEYDIALGGHIARFRHNLNPKYLSYFFQSPYFHKAKSQYTRGFKVVEIKASDIAKIPIPIIQEDAQQRVVEQLDAEFSRIDTIQKNAVRSRHQLENIIQERYSYYFGAQKERRQLGSILNLRRGHDLTHAQMIPGEIPVAGSNGIIGWHTEKTNISPCVTVGRSGSVGMVNFYDICWAHNTVLYVDDYKGNDPRYIYHLLKGLRLKEHGGGVAVPTLNRNNLHPLLVGYNPNIEEQIRVARDLDELTSKVKNLEDHYTKIITLCNDLKRSLLKSIFE